MTKTKAAGLSAAFIVSGLVLSVLLAGLGAAVFRVDAGSGIAALTTLQSAAFLAAFGLATWVVGVRLGGLDAATLRWRAGPMDFARGLAIGAVPAGLAMVLAVPLAGATWRLDGAGVTAWIGMLPALLAILLPAALAEELIFRGVPLVLLGRAFGRRVAIVGLALLFSLAHARNDHVTPLALVNVALAGVFLGLVFYQRGGLVTAFGAHVGWNLALAALAAPVSGLPFPVPWLDYAAGGPAWLSGAAFGPEGGILATAALGAAAVLAFGMMERTQESSA